MTNDYRNDKCTAAISSLVGIAHHNTKFDLGHKVKYKRLLILKFDCISNFNKLSKWFVCQAKWLYWKKFLHTSRCVCIMKAFLLNCLIASHYFAAGFLYCIRLHISTYYWLYSKHQRSCDLMPSAKIWRDQFDSYNRQCWLALEVGGLADNLKLSRKFL